MAPKIIKYDTPNVTLAKDIQDIYIEKLFILLLL